MAKKQVGIRYRIGGSSPSTGFDCSGLTQYIYGKHGKKLPRSAAEQFGHGQRIPNSKIKPGDLLFFRINHRKISHVGIYIGRYRFVHAPGTGKKVRIDSVKNSYWRSRFAGSALYLK